MVLKTRTAAVLTLIFLLAISFAISCDDDDDDSDSDAGTPADDDDSVDDDDDISDDNDDNSDDDDDTCEGFQWPYNAPDERGPYDVGVTTIYLTDDSRYEVWGRINRTLPLEIWYPSTGQGGVPNNMEDMVGPVPDWAWGILESFYGEAVDDLIGITTTAMRGAELQVPPCPYPVIFFSHGLTAIRFQNFTLCEYLASHGFIVVAPDHYANAVFTNIPDKGLVFFNPISTVTSFWNRLFDIRFVYDAMVRMNADAKGDWYKIFDMEHFAITGHSYGGVTSLASGPTQDFVKAIAPLNPGWINLYVQDFGKPFFLLQGELDRILADFTPGARIAWEGADSDQRIFINMLRGGHYSATDACLLLPPEFIPPSTTGCGDDEFITTELANEITQNYLTAFFRSALMKDDRYDDYLKANYYGEELEFISTWAGK